MDQDLVKFKLEVEKAGFSIFSPKDIDSLGTVSWREYLTATKLKQAWAPQESSPYNRYIKTKTIEAIDQYSQEIMPRYSEGELESERGVENLIRSGATGRDIAVILDSGGAHSVAMAIKLMQQGYQPVVMFDSIPHPEGAIKSEQDLATLLYFASQAEMLKKTGKVRLDSPPVFILDTHRDGVIFAKKSVNNSYSYKDKDFPEAQELSENGISSVIYLNEGDQNGQIRPGYQSIDRVHKDLKGVILCWERSGVKIKYTGVKPWRNGKSQSMIFKYMK